jgi:arylsulfate sulfotransferase
VFFFCPRWVFVCASSLMLLYGCSNSATNNSTSLTINPSSALVYPGQQFQFNAVVDLPSVPQFQWEVNGVVGGSSTTGTINTSGVYTAPASMPSQPIIVGIKSQQAQAGVTIFDAKHFSTGLIGRTAHPLVATYTIGVPAGSSVQVQFGTDTSYGLSTSSLAAPAAGGPITLLVAGMRASTTYHMRASIQEPDGSTGVDSDHTFTTGAIPASVLPNISTQLTGVGTPNSGIELLSLVPNDTSINQLAAVATDLAGNVIWYYPLPSGAYPEPIRPMANGHMLVLTQGPLDDVREVDLAGNIINDVTLEEVNQSLSKIADFQILQFTHDVIVLPNGRWLILASNAIIANNVPGIANGNSIAGNAVIDWDVKNGFAVWAWSTFDHMDFSHAPYGLSDWTHGNALAYTPDDGNILLSLRNQNWILKLNYKDGEGDGSILWHFGPDGDFTLPNGQAPIDWNYGQHFPTIQGDTSAGIFSLMFFDNGNNRLVDSNDDICGTTGQVACYSSVPIYQLNEYSKTASVLWQNNLTPAYSICCGDALVLPNGNVEFDVALDVNTPNASYLEEVTQSETPELVWKMVVTNQLAYRGYRIPSLYPGQTWPANLQ